ncbi:hypothetical protein MMC31_006348, partial [Peltigera leucophlebia]|nr:hypothetical protein [Peltigera leucophlebia]
MTNNNMISKEDFNNHQVCAAGHEKTSMSQNPVTVNPKVTVKKDSNHQAGETTEAEPTAANPNPLAVYREIAKEEDASDDDGVELISEVANNEDSDHEFVDGGPEIEENPFAVYPEVAVEPIDPQADLSRLGLMWWEEEWSETDYQNLR